MADPEEEPTLDGSESREARYELFVGLLARNDQTIRWFVRSLLPARDGVDDVVQETALECWNKFSSFQPNEPDSKDDEFCRWACVIARYKALSWQRDRARDRLVFTGLVFRDSVLELLADAAMEGMNRRERQREAVEACLDSMPDAQRRLVMSVHTPGQSVARIAAETGEQARRLYGRINALRKQLVDCVQSRLRGDEFAGDGFEGEGSHG